MNVHVVVTIDEGLVEDVHVFKSGASARKYIANLGPLGQAYLDYDDDLITFEQFESTDGWDDYEIHWFRAVEVES